MAALDGNLCHCFQQWKRPKRKKKKKKQTLNLAHLLASLYLWSNSTKKSYKNREEECNAAVAANATNVDGYKRESVFLNQSAHLQRSFSGAVQHGTTLGSFCRLFEYETGQVLC